tara:strand:+ start:132 stop:320 length:189 start_codon:yes stop_codon:yes gene_type:complete
MILNKLIEKVIRNLKQNNADLEKECWITVHEYIHGFKPVEYDIREIDEDLYNDLLLGVKSLL